MVNDFETIEDLLESLAGLKKNISLELETTDATIINSIARQVFRGTALTDRQFALMQEKLKSYKEKFEVFDCDFDKAVSTLRQPLREIDRSKYIKICKSSEEIPLAGIDENRQWFKVRFPFSKNLIMNINNIPNKNNNTYFHEKGSHEHYFIKTESMIYQVIDKFTTNIKMFSTFF